MKKLAIALVVAAAGCSQAATPPAPSPEVQAWQKQAQNITITRDDWGIAHVHGKTDADAVFGMVYAQAEDDFNRIERNFLVSLGRLAEAEGEKEIYRDLRQRLFINDADLKAQYAKAEPWLRALMDGWAAGLNYYLHTHPEVTPRALKKFEPWMALSFSEGSIGGDIERVNLAQLEAFYGKAPEATLTAAAETGMEPEPTGSNGIAVAPANTTAGQALLLINPHTSFFFRSELHMSSDEGLNAYGAATWGQFFIYQGFNETAGWMHTSSSVDNIDEFLETVTKRNDAMVYKYGDEFRPLTASKVTVSYKNGGGLGTRDFTVYRTHRGPIVRIQDGKWVSFKIMEEPLKALTQSYSRTKAKNLKAYREVMALHTNSSNNTLYADAEGNIAYFHSNFVPKRDAKFDWTRPVDGSNPAAEWTGVHTFEESPNAVNPASGWAYNTNNWPYSAAGANSPKQKDYPAYMDSGTENPRGVHAIRVLDKKKDFTLDSLVAAAYDSLLVEFEAQIPLLLKSYDQAATAEQKKKLADPIKELRGWDYRWSAASVPTSVAIFWGEDLWQRVSAAARKANVSVYEYMRTKATSKERIESLGAAVDKLTADFGKWNTPWGDINRFQRLTGDIVQPFNDAAPSLPVHFTSARWGSLASYGARAYPTTKKWYGTSGNSFVAVVEFGKQVRARAVTAGGESGDPMSPHFNDQAERYATGNLREVYFYPDQVKAHARRTYQPGPQ
jgi:acyl-homoserine lactone acylase PvdQ